MIYQRASKDGGNSLFAEETMLVNLYGTDAEVDRFESYLETLNLAAIEILVAAIKGRVN